MLITSLRVVDIGNNPVEGISVTVSLNENEFTAGSTTEVSTDENGIAEFNNLVIQTARDDYELTFSAIDLDDLTSAKFEVTSTEIDRFDIFASDGDPVGEQVAGEMFSLLIHALDEFDNIVKNYEGDFNPDFSGAGVAPDGESDPDYPAEVTFNEGIAGGAEITLFLAEDDVEITITDGSTTGTTNSFDVLPADINSLELVGPGNVIAGQVSDTFTLSVLDEFENVTPVDGDTQFDLSSTGTAFYADPAGDTEITDFTVTDGGGTGEFFYSTDQAGDQTVTATWASGDLLLDGSSADFEIRVDVGDIEQLAVVQEPSDVISGVGFPEAQYPIIQLQDGSGNSVAEENVEVTVSLLQGDGNLAGTLKNTTDEDGRAVFENLTITGDANTNYILGFEVDGPITVSTNEFEVIDPITTVSASESTVTVDPDELTVGEASVVTVTLFDGDQNPVDDIDEANFTLTFEGSKAEIVEDSFESDENEYTFGVTNTTAELVTVAVEVSATVLDDEPVITFNAGTPVAENTTAEVPNGTPGEETVITITVTDEFGNPVEGVQDLLDVVISGANEDADISDIEDVGDGEYTISYTPEVIGDDDINISLDGNEIDDSPYTSTVSAGNVEGLIIVSGNEQSGDAGVELEESLVVQLQDEFENPVRGRDVTFEVTSSPDDTDSYELSAETVETEEDGTAKITFTLGSLPGEYTIVAEYEELSAEFTLTATAGLAATIEKISGDDQTQPTRSVLEDSLVLQVLDEFDNPVPNSNVYFAFSQTPDNALDQSATPDTVSTDSEGFAKSEVRLGSEDGDYRVEVSTDNEDVDSAFFDMSATFTAPDPAFVDTVNTVVFNGGLESYMFAEFDESMDQTEGMTYETWVLPNALDSDGYFSKRWNSEDLSNSQYRIHIEGNLLTVELMDEDGDRYTITVDDFFRNEGESDENGGENAFTASSVVSENNENGNDEDEFSWTHISLVADPVGETISLYRDGFELERRQLNNNLQSSDEEMEVGLGFNGEIHEVRLWDIPRSGRDIQALKDLILTGEEDNLVLYHSFDEDGGDVAFDATEYGNDFYFGDDVDRRRSLRNVTRITVNQDSDFVVRLAALDATGGTVNAEVIELPGNGTLYQLDYNVDPTDEISDKGIQLTDEFNRSLYAPDNRFAGTDSIQYRMYDQYGNFTTATMIFEVLEVNRPPVVSADLSKIEFYQRETFEVFLDTVVTDNFYTPEEIQWSIELTDSRFDWEITANGDIKQKETNQEPDQPMRDRQRSGREFDNNGNHP